MRPHILIAAAVACALLPAVAPAAQFNARVSAKEIALNQPVVLTFSTTRPQIDDVDPAFVVQSALDLPTVGRTWRLVEPPEVVQHEKAKDISVAIKLLPREAGELQLPEIPVRWLEHDRTATFGMVTVAPTLRIGSETRSLPKEVERIAGFAWGMEQQAVRDAVGDGLMAEHAGATVALPRPGLELHFIDQRLGRAVIVSEGLPLAQARGSFIARWGEPLHVGERVPAGPVGAGSSLLEPSAVPARGDLEWVIGWLRIRAAEAPVGTVLEFVHEGIEGSALRRKIREDVFGPLEQPSPGRVDPPQTGGGDAGGAAAADPAPAADEQPDAADGPTRAQIEAEIDRRLELHQRGQR